MPQTKSCECRKVLSLIVEDEMLNEEDFKIALHRTLESTRESLNYASPEERDMQWELLYEKLLTIFRSMNP